MHNAKKAPKTLSPDALNKLGRGKGSRNAENLGEDILGVGKSSSMSSLGSTLSSSSSTSSLVGSGSAGGNVKVVCRVRPLNEKELAMKGVCAKFTPDRKCIKVTTEERKGKEDDHDFIFDHVFDPDSTQEEVYESAAMPIVESVLEGFNGTILAYGQTASGKTYTMQGELDQPELTGIVPRMVRHVFDQIEISSETMEFTIKVAMLEIYMEKIKDLFNPSDEGLKVHQDKQHGIFVEGMTEHCVGDEDEVYDFIKMGNASRAIGVTDMNSQSSRSHSIFIMTISMNDLENYSCKVGKLYLVDLAGSEKISKTGAHGQLLEEAKKINKSLTMLGRVIYCLTEGNSHIPYRDSKLTRILQDSLGGNSKTCLVITCSPSIYNAQETLSTCRFGMRAKRIKNKAKVNKQMTVAELQLIIQKLEHELHLRNQRMILLEQLIEELGGIIPTEDDVHINIKKREAELKKQKDQKALPNFDYVINEGEIEVEEVEDMRLSKGDQVVVTNKAEHPVSKTKEESKEKEKSNESNNPPNVIVTPPRTNTNLTENDMKLEKEKLEKITLNKEVDLRDMSVDTLITSLRQERDINRQKDSQVDKLKRTIAEQKGKMKGLEKAKQTLISKVADMKLEGERQKDRIDQMGEQEEGIRSRLGEKAKEIENMKSKNKQIQVEREQREISLREEKDNLSNQMHLKIRDLNNKINDRTTILEEFAKIKSLDHAQRQLLSAFNIEITETQEREEIVTAEGAALMFGEAADRVCSHEEVEEEGEKRSHVSSEDDSDQEEEEDIITNHNNQLKDVKRTQQKKAIDIWTENIVLKNQLEAAKNEAKEVYEERTRKFENSMSKKELEWKEFLVKKLEKERSSQKKEFLNEKHTLIKDIGRKNNMIAQFNNELRKQQEFTRKQEEMMNTDQRESLAKMQRLETNLGNLTNLYHGLVRDKTRLNFEIKLLKQKEERSQRTLKKQKEMSTKAQKFIEKLNESLQKLKRENHFLSLKAGGEAVNRKFSTEENIKIDENSIPPITDEERKEMEKKMPSQSVDFSDLEGLDASMLSTPHPVIRKTIKGGSRGHFRTLSHMLYQKYQKGLALEKKQTTDDRKSNNVIMEDELENDELDDLKHYWNRTKTTQFENIKQKIDFDKPKNDLQI